VGEYTDGSDDCVGDEYTDDLLDEMTWKVPPPFDENVLLTSRERASGEGTGLECAGGENLETTLVEGGETFVIGRGAGLVGGDLAKGAGACDGDDFARGGGV